MYKALNSNFRQDQKHKTLASIATTVAFSFIVGSANLVAASDLVSSDFNQDMLTAVAELHGISEDQAVERLVRETEAAINFKQIKELSLESYAGAWFDESSLRLKVAIANPEDVVRLESLDVDPVNVRYSLTDLKNKLIQATNQLSAEHRLGDSPISSYIDYKSNNVVLGVRAPHIDFARSELDAPGYSDSIRVVENENDATISTGSVRGADGTRNLTWDLAYPTKDHPCSIGASVEDGYITAGHCGYLDDSIGDVSSNSLGTVDGSIWDTYNPSLDTGVVTTGTGWTPSPLINGYTDGVFSVSAEWGGMLEFPVGLTVCRYGGTSGGPYCGTVDQLNVAQEFGLWPYWNGSEYVYFYKEVTGLTKVEGSCSDPGDSGGTWMAGTGQFQGTNTGKIGYDPAYPCPTEVDYTFFQPFEDADDSWDVTLLTEHGASAPSVNFAMCPNMNQSGGGHYLCELKSADSQGEIEMLWTTNTGHSSTSMELSGSCSFMQTVNVTLKMTNPYGSTYKYYSFLCPSIPNQ